MDKLDSLKKEARRLRDQKDEMIRKIFDFEGDGHSDIKRMNEVSRSSDENFIKEFIEDQKRWIAILKNINLPQKIQLKR